MPVQVRKITDNIFGESKEICINHLRISCSIFCFRLFRSSLNSEYKCAWDYVFIYSKFIVFVFGSLSGDSIELRPGIYGLVKFEPYLSLLIVESSRYLSKTEKLSLISMLIFFPEFFFVATFG